MAWYVAMLASLWVLLVMWVRTIFVTPFENAQMLWLLVPIWLAWFFAEFFQEKVGTSRGNAITNAVVVLWGSIDCTRQTISLIMDGTIKASWDIFLRFSIIAFLFGYGALIIWLGVRGSRYVKYVGRVREVTYVFVMFVPVLYSAIPFSWAHILATVLFFPAFYYVLEVVCLKIPNPRSVDEDIREGREYMPKA